MTSPIRKKAKRGTAYSIPMSGVDPALQPALAAIQAALQELSAAIPDPTPAEPNFPDRVHHTEVDPATGEVYGYYAEYTGGKFVRVTPRRKLGTIEVTGSGDSTGSSTTLTGYNIYIGTGGIAGS